jgi:hypothetical protein
MRTSKPVLIIRTLVLCLVALGSFGCTGSIGIRAETNFPQRGGQRPLSRHTVYLLKNSITSPEMEEAFKKYMASTTPPVNPGMPLDEKEVRTRLGFLVSDGRKIWHRYIIESVETDFEGKAKFRKLGAGDYWLYCKTKGPSGEWLIWDVKATVEFYENTVTLNNQNILK